MKSAMKQKGQSFILTIAFAAIATTAVILLYNSSQVSNEKTKLVNAADAAAYSAGTWTARQLNFMAYTNRAMLSNHVMVGHFVSHASWMEYAAESLEDIQTLTAVLEKIPVVGQFVAPLNAAVDQMRPLADNMHLLNENIGPELVAGVDSFNEYLSTAQTSARNSLGYGAGLLSATSPITQVMQETVDAYSTNIKINDFSNVISGDPDLPSTKYKLSSISEINKIGGYTKKYNPQTKDAGYTRMNYMVEQSYDDSQKWLTDRDWKFSFPIKLRKQSTNTQGLDSWESTDRMQWKNILSKNYKTLADGDASAEEFSPGYRGVHEYHDISQLNPTQQETLFITAHASMPLEDARVRSLLTASTDTNSSSGEDEFTNFDMVNSAAATAPRLSAVSTAEIFHQRSKVGFSSLGQNRTEYSNTFNPFWQTRLKSSGSSSEGEVTGGNHGGGYDGGDYLGDTGGDTGTTDPGTTDPGYPDPDYPYKDTCGKANLGELVQYCP